VSIIKFGENHDENVMLVSQQHSIWFDGTYLAKARQVQQGWG
jgi:hypothetical protein